MIGVILAVAIGVYGSGGSNYFEKDLMGSALFFKGDTSIPTYFVIYSIM
jgi:hypothetical protein